MTTEDVAGDSLCASALHVHLCSDDCLASPTGLHFAPPWFTWLKSKLSVKYFHLE